MPRKKVILVAGATGKQGRAVAQEVLSRGFGVRALCRNPEGAHADALARRGAEVVPGDFDDRSALRRAMEGVDAVFGLAPVTKDAALEVRFGKNLVDAAKAANIGHFIYSSVVAAAHHTGVPHFETKAEIEAHLAAAGLFATVLRPVFFLSNFADGLGPRAAGSESVLRLPLAPTSRLQLIAVEDIAVFAALALEGHPEVAGKAIELAGDELKMTEIARAFEEADGVRTRFEEQPLAEVRAFSEDLAKMFEWFALEDYDADIAKLRTLHPGLSGLRSWLRAHAAERATGRAPNHAS